MFNDVKHLQLTSLIIKQAMKKIGSKKVDNKNETWKKNYLP